MKARIKLRNHMISERVRKKRFIKHKTPSAKQDYFNNFKPNLLQYTIEFNNMKDKIRLLYTKNRKIFKTTLKTICKNPKRFCMRASKKFCDEIPPKFSIKKHTCLNCKKILCHEHGRKKCINCNKISKKCGGCLKFFDETKLCCCPGVNYVCGKCYSKRCISCGQRFCEGCEKVISRTCNDCERTYCSNKSECRQGHKNKCIYKKK